MDWMRERQADAAFARGYSEQMAWLEGKTVEEAQHALISRAARTRRRRLQPGWRHRHPGLHRREG